MNPWLVLAVALALCTAAICLLVFGWRALEKDWNTVFGNQSPPPPEKKS
jgi:hypothetical protein